jgi:Core-2/I-Branching enzyme
MISYDHKVNKDEIWKKWIEPNKDIINVYFHYKDYNKIQSDWIKKHAIPQQHTAKTSYYHVVPAIMSLFSNAYHADTENQWFCLVTESCVPIISPKKFRELFFNHNHETIMGCRKAWWNPKYHKRANLRHFPEDFHLGNEPWFVLCKEDLKLCFHFIETQNQNFDLICRGGLANESIFAMIFHYYKRMPQINNGITHLTDWSRMASATSPHLFKEGNQQDLEFISEQLEQQPFAMFLRKVSAKFPDDILMKFIGPLDTNEDDSNSISNSNSNDRNENKEEDKDNDHGLVGIDNNYIKNEMNRITWGIDVEYIIYFCRFMSLVILIHAMLFVFQLDQLHPLDPLDKILGDLLD